MKKRTNFLKVFKFLGKVVHAVLNVGVAILHTLAIDLPKNTILYVKMAINKEEREKIRHKLKVEKNQELIDDRLQRVERLVYAVYNDPTYGKRKEGEYDLKQLKKETEK